MECYLVKIIHLNELPRHVGYAVTDPVTTTSTGSRITQTNLWLTIVIKIFEFMDFDDVINPDSVGRVDIVPYVQD